MYNKNSLQKCEMLFKNILKELPMPRLSYLIGQHHSDRYKKTFCTFSLFKTLLLSQILEYKSIREIETSIITKKLSLSNNNPFVSLNISSLKRSTFSYSNSHCDSTIFKEFFYSCLNYFESKSYWKWFKRTLDIPLFALDSSTISLPFKLCWWAKYKTTKWWIKLHTLLANWYIPEYVKITEANISDIAAGRDILKSHIPPNSCAVFDLGYVDYKLYAELTKKKIFFVSRAKSNMVYDVVSTTQINNVYENGIINFEQEILCLLKWRNNRICRIPLRAVNATIIWEDWPEKFTFVTNNFELTPEEVAECYRLRWRVELFFKFIKQNLIIKSFLWNSRNAVENQIRTALIYYLFICYLKFKCNAKEERTILMYSIKAGIFDDLTILDILGYSENILYKPPSDSELKNASVSIIQKSLF